MDYLTVDLPLYKESYHMSCLTMNDELEHVEKRTSIPKSQKCKEIQ